MFQVRVSPETNLNLSILLIRITSRSKLIGQRKDKLSPGPGSKVFFG